MNDAHRLTAGSLGLVNVVNGAQGVQRYVDSDVRRHPELACEECVQQLSQTGTAQMLQGDVRTTFDFTGFECPDDVRVHHQFGEVRLSQKHIAKTSITEILFV